MSDYYALVTTTGLAKLAALPVGGTLTLTHMAFGNSTIDPTEDMTALHSEQHRCALLNVEVEATNPNNLAAEAVIDSTVGGFWIREVGIYDEDGDLFAVGKYPATYKPETTGFIKRGTAFVRSSGPFVLSKTLSPRKYDRRPLPHWI